MKSNSLRIIFDLDGTLIDSASDISNAINLIRLKYGFPVRHKQAYEPLIGLPAINLLNDLHIEMNQKEKLIKEFRECLKDFIAQDVKLFPGIPELLNLLNSLDIEIGIATSKPTSLAKFTIDNSTIGEHNWKIQGTDGFSAKPSPEVVLRCMKLMDSEQFIMIGDRIEDIQAARTAKVLSIGVAQTFHTQVELSRHGADATFQNINELLAEIREKKMLFFNNF